MSGLPETIRMIGVDGSVVGDLPDISKTEILELYRLLLLSRELDERCDRLLRGGRIGFWAPAIATEAVAVGAATALVHEDWVFASPRFPGFALARGVTPSEILAGAVAGRPDSGPSRPGHRGHADARIAPSGAPNGSGLMEATGAALALSLREDDSLVLACCGDGVIETPAFHGAMTMAECGPCAMVVLVEDARAVASIAAAGFDMPVLEADGHDVLAVRTAVEGAAGSAREELRPVMVAALVDDDDDPTERLRMFLEARGHLDRELADEIARAARREVEAAVEDIMGDASARDLFEHVAAADDAGLARQRAAWSRFGGLYGGDQDADAGFLLEGETS